MFGSIRLFQAIVVIVAIILSIMIAQPELSLAQEPAGANSPYDLTGNGVVDDADARRVAEAWYALQEAGACMAPQWLDYDFNQDGCIDIADIQIVLAHWGERSGAVRMPTDEEDLEGQALAIFTVDSSGNATDMDLNDEQCLTSSGDCTLRAAIRQANARPGREEIRFNIRGSGGSCPDRVTISPSHSQLLIDDPRNEGIVIDGYSQCGANPNTRTDGGNADIRIQIAGGSGDGLVIYSANNIIRGLSVYGWDRQIVADGSGARNNLFEGNFIGGDADNNCSAPKGVGILLETSAAHNTIGGTSPQARNVITCTRRESIQILGKDADFNTVIGNFIGLKQDGETKGNTNADGIDLAQGASDNVIGGLNPNQRNIISGNGRDGIEISHQTLTRDNYVIGNYIGLDVTGTKPVGNGNNGITLEDLINRNYIYGNVIVDNGANGIRGYALCNDHQIYDNYIGVGIDGQTPIPNGINPSLQLGRNGIYLFGGCQRNLIRNNIIANSVAHGVLLTRQDSYLHYSQDTDYNTITKNSIYNNNNAGIRLAEDDGEFPNKGIKRPEITFANTATVIGEACPNCKIEIFIADKTTTGGSDSAGEGKIFIGEGVTNAQGDFRITVGNVDVGQLVTGTATDGDGNTSEFAVNVRVEAAPPPPPPPTPTPTPTPTRKPQPVPDSVIWIPIILK